MDSFLILILTFTLYATNFLSRIVKQDEKVYLFLYDLGDWVLFDTRLGHLPHQASVARKRYEKLASKSTLRLVNYTKRKNYLELSTAGHPPSTSV